MIKRERMKDLLFRKMKREDIIVWGSFLLSLCVILCQIQGAFSYDLWVDEAFSIRMLEHSYGEMIALTAKDVHPPLYYIILKAGIGILNFCFAGRVPEIFCARLISDVPFILLWLMALIWVRPRWGNHIAALFAICIVAAPQLTGYGIDIRMYSWALLFVTGSFMAAFELVRNDGHAPRAWISFVVFGLMAAYTHYFALVSVAIAWLMILVDAYRKKDIYLFKTWVIWMLITVLAYLPWMSVLFQQMKTVKSGYWIPTITAHTVWNYVIFAFGNIPCVVITLLVILLAFVKRTSAMNDERKWAIAWSVGCTTGTVAIGILASVLIRPVFVERYMVPALGCLWFGFCLAWDSLDISWLKKTVFALSVLFAAYNVTSFVVQNNRGKQASKELMQTLSAQNNAVYVMEDAQVRNIFGALTGSRCFQYGYGIDDLSKEVFGNIDSIEGKNELLDLLKEDTNLYFVEKADEEDTIGKIEQENAFLKAENIGTFFVQNTVSRKEITLYKISSG